VCFNKLPNYIIGIFKEALKDDSSISRHFESDEQYEVAWPDLRKPGYRTAGELSTPELYG
jgi:hypothetical protein